MKLIDNGNVTSLQDTYVPDEKILKNYADLLVKCALGGGAGVKPGEVVCVRAPECAKPLFVALRRSILESGAHMVGLYTPDGMSREFFEIANDEQIGFFPDKYYRGLVDQMDHLCGILASTNKHELEGIDPKKVQRNQSSVKPWMEWREQKENAGKLTWTLGLYGTPQMAAEVGMTAQEYWAQIINACYLDHPDPVARWREVMAENERVREKLDALKIDELHVIAQGTDLRVGLGENRKWLGGTGRNIPSFEVFTSPDWRRVNGKITFTEPLYRYGSLIEGVYAHFENGVVTRAGASKGEDIFLSMIAEPNANKIGEFSLTDSRLSRITRFMGETLYDENVGGANGNTHLAFGKAYKDAYPGDTTKITKEEWDRMGYNDSPVHTDIVATSPRVVTAKLMDGSKRVIYQDGKFTI